MLRLVCILLVFLTHQAHGGSLTTEEHSDLAATAIQSNKLLTRIIKYVNIEYPIALVVGRVWSQVPDCSMLIDLPFAQAVNIRYNLQIWSPSNGLLITRVIIDGREHPNYLVTTGYTIHHNNWSQDTTWLAKGRHEIKLEYCNDVSFSPLHMGNSLTTANFKVEYFVQG